MLVDTLFAASPKTASTWLFDKLQQHQEVCVNPAKYTHFFNRNYERGTDWYDAHFTADPLTTRAVVDFEPTAVLNPIGQRRVLDAAESLRLVIGLRNPLQRDCRPTSTCAGSARSTAVSWRRWTTRAISG
jgi:hypothetical protein